jgi:riboflavin biosynthesis pyrimidine reductase
VLEPFDLLYEEDLPGYDLPADLEALYGRLGFAEQAVYSNFVSSLDGVVSLGSTPSAGSVISGKNQADRFLMGLLRACADAVIVGAGTLRATPGHLWTPEHVYPDLAPSFAKLRERLHRRPAPRLVLVTSTGEIDLNHPAVAAGATIVTTATVAGRLEERLPGSCDVIGLGEDEPVDLSLALAELRARGHAVLLTEGGPHLLGELMKRGLVDEAFLTVSPVIAGRGSEPRLGMAAGVEFLPGDGLWSDLLSARRHGGFLFLRYRLPRA